MCVSHYDSLCWSDVLILDGKHASFSEQHSSSHLSITLLIATSFHWVSGSLTLKGRFFAILEVSLLSVVWRVFCFFVCLARLKDAKLLRKDFTSTAFRLYHSFSNPLRHDIAPRSPPGPKAEDGAGSITELNHDDLGEAPRRHTFLTDITIT